MTKTCQACNTVFEGRRHAKTCSDKCRKRMQRLAQAAAQELERVEVRAENTVRDVAREVRRDVQTIETSLGKVAGSQAGFAAIAEPLVAPGVAKQAYQTPSQPRQTQIASSQPVAQTPTIPSPSPEADVTPNIVSDLPVAPAPKQSVPQPKPVEQTVQIVHEPISQPAAAPPPITNTARLGIDVVPAKPNQPVPAPQPNSSYKSVDPDYILTPVDSNAGVSNLAKPAQTQPKPPVQPAVTPLTGQAQPQSVTIPTPQIPVSTSLPEAESLESQTVAEQKPDQAFAGASSQDSQQNTFASQFQPQSQTEAKSSQPEASGLVKAKKRLFKVNKTLVKLAGVAALLTLLVGGWGLYIGDHTRPGTGSVTQSIPEQTLGLSASEIARLSGDFPYNQQQQLLVQGDGIFTGNLTAANFVGGGAGLTSLNASNISSGTISADRLPDNVTLLGDSIPLANLQGSVVSSLNNVTNNGGNINLVAGANITITADDATDAITISADLLGGGSSFGDIFNNGQTGPVRIGTNDATSTILETNDTDRLTIDSSGTFTFNGSASSNIVFGGVTVSAAELNLLDGHDVALVDINDAVNTAIIGTGALNVGSITSGFGSIDTGSDNITTTGTVFGNNFDRSSAGGLTFGDTNASSVSICNSASCDTVTIGTNTDADIISIGDGSDTLNLTAATTTVSGHTSGAANALVVTNSTSTGNILVLNDNITTVATVADGGAVTFQNSADSAAALRILNAAGTGIITADTSAGTVKLGTSGSLTGGLVFQHAVGAGSIVLLGDNPGASSYTITLPAATGSVCLTSGNCAGVGGTGDLLNNGQPGAIRVGTNDATSLFLETNNTDRLTITSAGNATYVGGTTGDALTISNSTSTGNILVLQDNLTNVLTIADGGAATFQNSVDSTTGFRVLDLDGGNPVLNVDTLNERVGIGLSNPGYALDINGDLNLQLGNAFRIGGTAICTSGGCAAEAGSANYIQNSASLQVGGNFYIESASINSVAGAIKGKTGQVSDLFQLEDSNGVDVVTFGATGNLLVKPSTNSASAFQVQDSTGNNYIAADTSGGAVNLCNSANCDTVSIGTNADADAINIGDSLDTLTLTGSSASTIVLNGITVSAAELNLLDGHDVALVDINDAVNTAIIGTGALNVGSITSGFGSIDTGSDNITTTGTVYGNNFDRSSVGGLTLGTTNANAVTVSNSGATTTINGASVSISSSGFLASTTITGALTLNLGNATTTVINQRSSGGGVIGIGDNAVANTIYIGANGVNTGNTQTILLGALGAAGTTNVTIGSNNNATAGTTTIQSKGTLAVGNTISPTINIQGGAAGTIGIGNNAVANTIQIGATSTGGNTQTVNIGTNNAAGTTNVTIGTGSSATAGTTTIQSKGALALGNSISSSIAIQGTVDGGGISIGTSNTTAGIALGGSTQTGTITIGQSLVTNTINIGAAGSSFGTQTINIGNTSNGGAIVNTTLGYAGANSTSPTASATVIQSGSGNIKLNANGGSVLVQNSTNSNTAFMIQNANASNTIFNASTVTQYNLLANSSFESNGTGWAKLLGSEFTFGVASSQGAQDGTQSLLVTTASLTNQGAKYTYFFQPNTTYELSVYAKVASGSMSTFDVGTNINGSTTTCLSGQSLNTNFVRFSCSFTTGTTTTGSDYIFMRNSAATVYTMVFDAAQLELGSSATTYQPDPYPNIVFNPSFEQNANGWSAKGSATISSSDDFAKFGTRSLKVATTAAANDGASFATPTLNGRYALSFYARRDTGSSSNLSFGNSSGSDTDCSTGNSLTTTWTQYTCTFTASNTTSIYMKQSTAAAMNMYIDGVTLVASGVAQAYNAGGSNLQVEPLYSNITLNATNSAELQPWQQTTGLSGGLRPGYVFANGYAYSLTEINGTVSYAKVNADGSLGAATTTTSLPGANCNNPNTTANGYLYSLAGNLSTNTYYAKLNSDGSVAAWQAGTSFPIAINGGETFVANGYIYFVGGSDNNFVCVSGGTQSAAVYYAKLNADGSFGSWTKAASSLPAGVSYSGVAVSNGYVYSVGGVTAGNNPTTAIYYAQLNADGSLGSWQTNSVSLPSGATVGTGATILNGYLYAFLGSQVVYARVNSDGSIGTFSSSKTPPPSLGSSYPRLSQNNGYLYVPGSFYTSPERVKIGGTLDLIGVGGQTASDGSGSTGSLIAGNTNVTGTLQVNGNANFAQNVSVGGSLSTGSTTVRNLQNSATMFQVQSAGAVNALNITTANYVGNSNFESGISGQAPDGWSAKGSGTPTVSNAQADFGTNSMQVVTTTAANDGAKYNYNFAASTTYTLSLYAKVASGSITDFVVGHQETGSDVNCLTGQTVNTTWTRFSCTFATGASISGTPNVYVQKSGASAETFFIDGVQLEVAGSVTNYRTSDVGLDGQVTIKPTADSTATFQVQNASGANLFNVDTTNSNVTVANAGLAGTVQIGNTTGAVAQTINIGNNATASSTNNVVIGSTVAGTVTLQPAGGVVISTLGTANTDTVLCRNGSNIIATCSSTFATTANAFLQGGNSFGATAVLGTNDTNNLAFETDGTTRWLIDTSGHLLPNVDDTYDIGSDTARVRDLYTGPGTIHVGTSTTDEGTISYNTTSNSVVLGSQASTGNGGVQVQNASDITNAFRVSSTYGDILHVNTSANTVTLGAGGAGGPTASLNIQGGADSALITLTRGTGSGDDAAIIFSNGTNKIGTFNATDNLEFKTNNSTVVTLANSNGAATFKNSANSQQAFQVQNSSSTSILDINTLTSGLNLVANPSIEANTNGYSAKGSATVSIDDSVTAQFGSRYLKAATTAAIDDGAKYTFPFAASTQYSLSFYARSTASTGANISFGRADNGTDTDCSTGNTLTTTWTQFTCTFTTGATIGSTSNFYVKQSDATARSIYIDGVTLVTGSTALAYVAPGSNLQVDANYSNLTLNSTNSGEIQPWQVSPNNLPAGRLDMNPVIVNGYAYVIGGDFGGNATTYYSKLNSDGSIGTWQTSTNTLPQNVHLHSTVAANGYIYVTGGRTGSASPYNSVYYTKVNADGDIGPWQLNSNNLPVGLDSHASVVANGYIYVTGGTIAGGTAQTAVYYAKLNADGSIGSWKTNASPLPTTMGEHTAVVANGYVYVFYWQSTYSAKINSDGSIGTWSTASTSLPNIRLSTGATVVNGYVYLIGGNSGGGGRTTTTYYARLGASGTIGSWQTSAVTFPIQTSNTTAVSINGYIYWIGGCSGACSSVQTTYITSTSRILAGGSLDLVGLGGQVLGDVGGTGGSLTAANGTFVGDLQVQGNANFNQAVSISQSLSVNGSVSVQTVTDSKTGFQVQGSTGQSIIDVNTTSFKNLLNEGSFEGGSAAVGGWAKLQGAETTFATSADAGFAKFGSQSLKVVTAAATANQGAKYTYRFKPNTTYTFSIYAAVSTSTISTFDIGYNVNGSTSMCSTGNTLTTTPTRFICTFTTGTTTTTSDYVLVRDSSSTSHTIYLDGAQLETNSGATSYADPVALNLVPNPSFEQGTNGWSAKGSGTTIGLDSTFAFSGNQALKVVTTTTTDAGASFTVPLLANTQYTLSVYARVAGPGNSITDFVVGRQDNGSDNTCLTGQTVYPDWTHGYTYTRFTCTFTTGATVNSTTNIFFQKSGASAETFYIDAVQLEQTHTASQYQEAFNNLQVDSATSTVTLNGSNSGEIQPWRLSANALCAAISDTSVVTLNGFIYVIGGANASAVNVNTVCYAKINTDGSAGAWSTTTAFPTTFADASAVAANGYVYVTGGNDGTNAQSTVYYAKANANGTLGSWSSSSNQLPAVRSRHSSATANGYLYVVAGTNTAGTVQSTVYYAKLNADGSTGAWAATQSTNTAVADASVAIANGYIYLVGGSDSGSTITTKVQSAQLNTDGTTGSWSLNTALPSARQSANVYAANGYIYAVGGYSGFATSPTTSVFYAKAGPGGTLGAWQTATNSLPVVSADGPGNGIGITVNGYMYVLGGYNGNPGAGTRVSTVFYTSTSRILAGGSLDLVGLGGQVLGDVGGTGGSLTAGNTSIIGTLNVQESANINGSLSVNGSGSFNGDLAVLSQTNNTPHTFTSTCNCERNSAAGTFGSQTSLDSITDSVVYKGKLFVAVGESDAAAVYRYDGGTTWTLVTYTTVGEAASDGTDATNIDAFVMAVYDGKLYIASQTGSTTGALYVSSTADTTANSFTLVNATRGTFNQASAPGVSDLAVWNGALYIATQNTNLTEIVRYDGGTTFTQVSGTDGTIDNTASNTVDAAVLAVHEGRLFAGMQTAGNAARVSVYEGIGTTWTALSSVGGIGGGNQIDDITSLESYNGTLFASTGETDGAEILKWNVAGNATSASDSNWQLVSLGAGEINSGDTVNTVDKALLKTYNGRLYAGSFTDATAGTTNSGGVYEYDSTSNTWTLLNGTRGTFGATTNVNNVTSLIEYNKTLFVGTDDSTTGVAAIYSWEKNQNTSYQLQFQSTPGNTGGISFIGDVQTSNFNQGNTGSFIFTHGIMTTTGAYDLAEDYPTRDDSLNAGELVSIDPSEYGFVKKTAVANDSTVVGVYSTNPGFRLSQQDSSIDGGRAVPIALAGRVPVKVTNEGGAIAPGDYLTSSTTPGYAKKATESGPVIGKALASFDSASGSVLAFVNISYYNPAGAQAMQGGDPTDFASLNVTGEATLGSLTVTGSAKFAGNIIVGGHIITQGDAPQADVDEASGTGAAASIEGNDTAGSLSLTAGTDIAPGKAIKVTFNKPFTNKPVVQLTPANDSAAKIKYFVEATADGFQITFIDQPEAGVTYKLNYWTVE